MLLYFRNIFIFIISIVFSCSIFKGSILLNFCVRYFEVLYVALFSLLSHLFFLSTFLQTTAIEGGEKPSTQVSPTEAEITHISFPRFPPETGTLG